MIKKKYKYGLVLSGGGTRGFAHLGAIKALEEHGIKPDIISGVSAGAIVG
ncbi:MAG: patatin-like phospholipase family protein, partial [Bacteroidales bacterium]